jgi:hypothetical protein
MILVLQALDPKISHSQHRNCIEILMKLMELGLVQVVYTCNAKEFLTPKQLKLEIQDEVCLCTYVKCLYNYI